MKYHLVERSNPRNLEDPKKFYASKVTRSTVSMRELSKDIAEMSTVSIVDVTAVIESMLQLLPKYLTAGDIVHLGDFGIFNLRISSGGADAEEDFDKSLIRGVKIGFRAGKELNKALKTVTYEKE